MSRKITQKQKGSFLIQAFRLIIGKNRSFTEYLKLRLIHVIYF